MSVHHFLLTNVPWISTGFLATQVSQPHDGTNDITIQTSDKSRGQLTKLVLKTSEGKPIFDALNDNKIIEELGVDYYKCSEWELKPAVKGPPPENSDLQISEPIEQSAIYSIDGEKYPA